MEGLFTGWNRELFVQLSAILTLTLGLSWGSRKILEKLSKNEKVPDSLLTFATAAQKPLPWIIAIYGAIVIVEIILTTGDNICFPPGTLSKLRSIFLVSTTSWIVLRWKNIYQINYRRRIASQPSRADENALVLGLSKVLSIFIFTIAGLMVLDIFDIQPTALLAFGGIGGLAIGWAGAPIVSNLLGGIMIHVNRPFAIGDWIMSPNKSFEGVVEHIGWYMTKIRTFARRPTFIPNAMINDAIIENPGRMYNRRIKESFNLRYEDSNKIGTIVNEIKEMLKQHREIDLNQFLFVNFLSFTQSGLEIEIYAFTKTTNWGKWRDIQQDVFLKIIQIVEKNGAQFAYPTQRYVTDSKPPEM